MKNLSAEQQDILSKLVAQYGNTCTRADLVAFQKKTKLPVLVNWIQKHKLGRGQYDLTQGASEPRVLPSKSPLSKLAKKAKTLQRPTTNADESFTDSANSAGLRKLMGGIETPAKKTKGAKLRSTGRRVVKDDDLDDGFGRMGDLRREARQLANGLGHTLGKFKSRAYTDSIQNSYCNECLALAIVNDSPQFEGMTHVYGPAVETPCSGHAPTLRGTFGGDDND